MSRLPVQQRVTSAQHTRDITLPQLNNELSCGVSILSVSSGGQLLVGQYRDSQLNVYSTDGDHVTSIDLPGGDRLVDAAWTPRGNIVYTTYDKVAVMSQSGDVVAQQQMIHSWYVYVSSDDVIYLADYMNGVHKSTDDGVTWTCVFKSPDGWHFRQIIKVSIDNYTDEFWTREYNTVSQCLSVYTLDNRLVNGELTWCDVTLPDHTPVDFHCGRLAFDGHTNIFMTDFDNRAVHVWSVSGQYERQLLSSQHFTTNDTNVFPQRLAIDHQRGHVMYVGKSDKTIGVYELTYESV